MKYLKFFSFVCALMIGCVFAEEAKADIFDFNTTDNQATHQPTTPATTTEASTPSTTDTKKVSLEKVSNNTVSVTSEEIDTDALLTEAITKKYMTLIDKKYALFEEALEKLPANVRQETIKKWITIIEAKKAQITEQDSIDALKKKTLVSILNYLLTKTKGLEKSAQNPVTIKA